MFQIDNSLAAIHGQILAWPGLTAHPHSFGGTEFRYRTAQVGHIHEEGAVHIPFTRAIHDELLAVGLARASVVTEVRLDELSNRFGGRRKARHLADAAVVPSLRAQGCGERQGHARLREP
jgi:hypothetical protein